MIYVYIYPCVSVSVSIYESEKYLKKIQNWMVALTEWVTPVSSNLTWQLRKSLISLGVMSQCFSIQMIRKCSLIHNTNPSLWSQLKPFFPWDIWQWAARQGSPSSPAEHWVFVAHPQWEAIEGRGSVTAPHKLAEVGGEWGAGTGLAKTWFRGVGEAAVSDIKALNT